MKQTINNLWLIVGVVLIVIFGAIGELARAVRETTGIPWAWSIIVGCALSFVLVMGIAALIRFIYSASSAAIRSYARSKNPQPVNENIPLPTEDD